MNILSSLIVVIVALVIGRLFLTAIWREVSPNTYRLFQDNFWVHVAMSASLTFFGLSISGMLQ